MASTYIDGVEYIALIEPFCIQKYFFKKVHNSLALYHVDIFYELVQVAEPLVSILILEVRSHRHHDVISLVVFSLGEKKK